MTTIFQRHLYGQDRIGIFTNLNDATDRATVGGYLAIHLFHWRLTFLFGA